MSNHAEEKSGIYSAGVRENHVVETVDHSSSGDEATLQKTTPGMNKAKWLACVGLCLAMTTSYQQQSCTSSIVKHIDEKLGPTTYYNWIITAYTICVSVSLPISGGLSDIFGRRWFVIGGCFVSLIGTVVALASQNIPMMIAAMGLKGLGSGCQQLALAGIAEIVPNKHRGYAQAALDIVTLPWAVFGSLTGNAMVKYYDLGFRINFIIGVILNGLTITTLYIWYHPPAGKRIVGETQWERARDLDWTGIALMAVGVVLFLVGITFGGNRFPWASAGTIVPIVLGVLFLFSLGIWEWKVAKEPFFAHVLFIGQGRTFSLFLVLTFVNGMSAYAAGAFWTQQVQMMWSRNPTTIGLSSIPYHFGGAVSGFLTGILMGKARLLNSRLMLIYGMVIKIVADGIFATFTPSDFKLAMGIGFMSSFGVSIVLVGLVICTQLSCRDENLGLATLVLGSVRAIGGAVAIAIFSSSLENTVKKDSGPRVAKVLTQPPYSIAREQLPALIKLVLGGKDQSAARLPGVTPEAVKETRRVLKYTWALAFRRNFYINIAFSAVALIAAMFVRDVTHNMTDHVAVTLQNDHTEQKKKLDTEDRS